jgi:hypothetical protein
MQPMTNMARTMHHTTMGALPMIAGPCISHIGDWRPSRPMINAQDPFDAADDAADDTAYDSPHWASATIAFRRTIGDSARHTLRIRRQGHGDREGENAGCYK